MVSGIVQGVGFRPFIYTTALQNHLTGWVRNTSSGVEIEVNGEPQYIQSFLNSIKQNPPPLARIDSLNTTPCKPNLYIGFEILESHSEEGKFLPVSPDISICPDCQRELFDPSNRRFRYPFINCTNCGPRFTIIKDIPYDRPKTTMAEFALCEACKSEYDDPLDRRFHAQPVACQVCGPTIWLESEGKLVENGEKALQETRNWIRTGKIIAVKGLGGYHLACDATNTLAVSELRKRKKRSDKPFALMAFDIQSIEKHCFVSEEERDLLLSRQRPIVILEKRPDSLISPAVTPFQNTFGFMIAYTPLHCLLLEPEEGYPDVLVMTSGNLSEEPIAYADQDARQKLSSIADGFLLHNRKIHMRVDDSVLRIFRNKPYFLRRSRSYAPDIIELPGVKNPPSVLATGAELKNSFCLTRQNSAFVSHFIGDLENLETLQSYEEAIVFYEQLFRIKPDLLVADLHPDYLATQYARQCSSVHQLPFISVQHHHAHMAACLAENGWTGEEPVIGLCFDGSGLGSDGAIWGGEVLTGDYHKFKRPYQLKYVPLPGGDLVVRKPARMALAHLWQAGIEWEPGIPSVDYICSQERNAIKAQLEHNLNAPLTSSMGRLFDAASSLLGIRHEVNYEGQAAIELEAIADPNETGHYELQVIDNIIDPTPLWYSLLKDWFRGVSTPILSARFHNSIAYTTEKVCLSLRDKSGYNTVALCGGVWQNLFLLERTVNRLELNKFTVLIHRKLPTNDASISLGQAMIAIHTSEQ